MDGETYKNTRELEKELNLPDHFLLSLYKEDDWSFIIKLHSLIEAAVTHLLLNSLADRRLENVVSSLQLGHKKTGKLAFIISLELLNDTNVRFIMHLSELRNKLIHNIANVQFNLKEYFDNLDPNKFNEFIKSFGHVFKEEIQIGGRTVTRRDSVKDEGPKATIFLAAAYCLSDIKKQLANISE